MTDNFDYIIAFVKILAMHRQESIEAYERAAETKHQRYEDVYRGRVDAFNVCLGFMRTSFRPHMTIDEFVQFCENFKEDDPAL